MRQSKPQQFELTHIPFENVRLQANCPPVLITSEQSELNRLVAANGRIKAHGPVLVRRLASGEVEFVAGRLQYAAAQALGISKLHCAIFTVVPDELADLAERFPNKNANPIEIAELIGILTDTLSFDQTQLASLLATQKSNICQLYKLNALPLEVKADRRVDNSVPKSQLLEIAKLPGDQQTEAYWETKKSISDRGNNSTSQMQSDLKDLCAHFLRTANKGTRVLMRLSSGATPLAEHEKKELFVAIHALMDALFGLKGFVEPNRFKTALRLVVRNLL